MICFIAHISIFNGKWSPRGAQRDPKIEELGGSVGPLPLAPQRRQMEPKGFKMERALTKKGFKHESKTTKTDPTRRTLVRIIFVKHLITKQNM